MGATSIYYLSNKIYRKCNFIGVIPRLLKNFNRIVYACDISYKADMGKNLQLYHQGLGVVIGPFVKIGDDCIICQNVTLGGGKGNGEDYHAPSVGNNVMIGAGAVILGGIHIGNNVRIGANSVVLQDIPDNCVVAGIPGVIKKMI